MTEITTKKELYFLIEPYDFNNKSKKYIKKLFSIGVNNKWKCYLIKNLEDPNSIAFNTPQLKFVYETETLYSEGIIYLKTLKFPVKIDMNNILFKSTGLKVNFNNYKYCYLIFSDGNTKYITGKNKFDTIRYLNNHNAVNIVTNIEDYYKQVLYGTNFRRLSYNEAVYDNIYFLCLKDILHFKRGMIVDYNRLYAIRNKPLDVVGEKAGVYRGVTNTISCDLNLTTLEELENIKLNSDSCVKGSFGCQRGCISECYATSNNILDKMTKEVLIKLYKEIFNEHTTT